MPRGRRKKQGADEIQLDIDGVDFGDDSAYRGFLQDLAENPPERFTKSIQAKQRYHLNNPCTGASYTFTPVTGLTAGITGYMRCSCGLFACWVTEGGETKSPKQVKEMRSPSKKKKAKK